jgi:glycosyl transferase, family 25
MHRHLMVSRGGQRDEPHLIALKDPHSDMKSLVHHFDRAYIINLIDRVDRRRHVIEEFRQIGIDVPNSSVHLHLAARPADKGTFRHIGELGCFVSHKQILEFAVRDNLRNVLVFEDDVQFQNVNAEAIREILSSLEHQKWDIVYFGYLQPEDKGLSGSLVEWSGATLGGHFYAVNGHFLQPMLQYMQACEARPAGHPDGGSMCRDATYNHFRLIKNDIRVLIAVPNLATQRSSRTDLHELAFYDRLAWLRPVTDLARRVKTSIKRR